MHEGDMFVVAITQSAWHAVGERIASFLIAVYHTCSERGQVKLTSRDWRDEPLVEFNLLSDRRDLERLMQAFRMMGRLYATPAMQAVDLRPVPRQLLRPRAQDRRRQHQEQAPDGGRRGAARRPGGAAELPHPQRHHRGLRVRGPDGDDEALEAFVRKAAIGVWHASCSCRMGADGDPMAVTDTQGRVRGVEGLRVVDASIFPLVPCANTNFPTLMTAEKIADAIVRSGPRAAPSGSGSGRSGT